jgi:patatin-like phospholipase
LTIHPFFFKSTGFMLEICLPVCGLASISLTGALTALRERKVIPEIITGVSGGAWAAIAFLSKCYKDSHGVLFTQMVRDHLISRPISRFLPPYADQGIPKSLLKYCMEHSSDSAYIKKLGVKHFYVGHTHFPSFRFVTEDVLEYAKREEIFQTIWKSSSLPFITHHGFHSLGGMDGGIRKLVFSSPHEVKERWVISNYVLPLKLSIDLKKFQRVIRIKTRIKLPLLATDRQIQTSFEAGYEEGMRLAI